MNTCVQAHMFDHKLLEQVKMHTSESVPSVQLVREGARIGLECVKE